MDELWWKQIPGARRFLRAATDALLHNESVILALPPSMPWGGTFYDLAAEELSHWNPRNRLETFPCPREDVGEYLLNHYCKKEKRATYRRGISHAAFLARSEGLVLNSCYLWVRDIRGEQLDAWIQFIAEYNRNLPHGHSPALFLLETAEEEARKKVRGIQRVAYSECVDAYDRFTFCALASADVALEPGLRPYLTELCSTLCGEDVELCAACIRRGRAFLEDPEGTLRAIAREEARSDGTPFDIAPLEAELPERIWRSQVRALFPVLQQYLSGFIQQHRAEIQRNLPITNSFGEVIDDPQDVELGLLVLLAASQRLALSGGEHTRLHQFRDARNSLAHMKPVDFPTASGILLAGL